MTAQPTLWKGKLYGEMDNLHYGGMILLRSHCLLVMTIYNGGGVEKKGLCLSFLIDDHTYQLINLC